MIPAKPDAVSVRSDPRQRGDGVGTVGLGGPDRVITKPLRQLHQVKRYAQLRARVSKRQSKLHGTESDRGTLQPPTTGRRLDPVSVSLCSAPN